MTLSAGTKLGPYELLAPIGAGGMGEVMAEMSSPDQGLAFAGFDGLYLNGRVLPNIVIVVGLLHSLQHAGLSRRSPDTP
jgi:hypothetical protein